MSVSQRVIYNYFTFTCAYVDYICMYVISMCYYVHNACMQMDIRTYNIVTVANLRMYVCMCTIIKHIFNIDQ